jgi:hypothetical protein
MLLWGGFRYPLAFEPTPTSIFPDDHATCDCDVLELDTWTWSRPTHIETVGGMRLSRAAHAAVLVGDTLLLFGGVHEATADEQAAGLGDLREADTHDCVALDTCDWTYRALEVAGPLPARRSSMVTHLLPTSVFVGATASGFGSGGGAGGGGAGGDGAGGGGCQAEAACAGLVGGLAILVLGGRRFVPSANQPPQNIGRSDGHLLLLGASPLTGQQAPTQDVSCT